MFAILHALGTLLVDLFKSRSRLEAENLFLRQQLHIALRRAPPRLRLRGSDRALLTWMTRLWPSLLGMAQVVASKNSIRRSGGCSRIRTQSRLMIAIAFLFVRSLCDCFKSRRRLDAELRDFSTRTWRFVPRLRFRPSPAFRSGRSAACRDVA